MYAPKDRWPISLHVCVALPDWLEVASTAVGLQFGWPFIDHGLNATNYSLCGITNFITRAMLYYVFQALRLCRVLCPTLLPLITACGVLNLEADVGRCHEADSLECVWACIFCNSGIIFPKDCSQNRSQKRDPCLVSAAKSCSTSLQQRLLTGKWKLIPMAGFNCCCSLWLTSAIDLSCQRRAVKGPGITQRFSPPYLLHSCQIIGKVWMEVNIIVTIWRDTWGT